ncbi:CdaR family protein [Salibacterium halotolerans]|uniref:YbbR domain-containing protein n=1 Tax=Salibacterium halotolerans TaxID=1884432 RepID=A0A1I5XQI9_9BACI|nr:CdaR family protein [Salibacterium halotolerans]SFQ34213.1 YbbR domain-containing protein [Salibacterium halotolerans]
MDKLFNNKWFVRFVSLLIAVMLYAMVNMDNVSNSPSVLPSDEEGSYTVQDVEVQVYYNEDQYEVVDGPETVDVRLTGPQTSIMLFQLSRPSYEVYADLEDEGAGTHNVRLQQRNFPADLEVSINPRAASIELQEQQTVSYPVELDINNESEVKEGYSLGQAEVTPEEVDIQAPQEVHENINRVAASVDVSGASETLQTESALTVYNEQGDELDVTTAPETVNVSVPVESPQKEVPVSLSREGNLPDNVSIVSLNMDPTRAVINGPPDVIGDINTLEAVLDLSRVQESGTLELPLEAPEGVEQVAPENITVEVEVGEEEERTIENVPITIENMPDSYSYTVTQPDELTSDVTVYGAATVLDGLNAGDLTLTADWENAEDGSSPSVIPVQPSGPPNVQVETGIDEITLEWSEESSSGNQENNADN